MTAKVQPVSNSSFIAGVGYDPENQTLTLQFTDGNEYEFNNVDDGTYNEMLQSESMGRFFHSRIKGQYSGRRV